MSEQRQHNAKPIYGFMLLVAAVSGLSLAWTDQAGAQTPPTDGNMSHSNGVQDRPQGNAESDTKQPAETGADCAACHTCQTPTPQERCLSACTRATPEAMARAFAGKHGPNVVILNELEDRYLPVPFDHKGHADMAEMTTGCTTCHHYTAEGTAHPACKSCHEVSSVREDMRKPGLKGAYHRQCMNCHREWSHETACGVCHPPKAGRGPSNGMNKAPSRDDIVGRMHPPIPEPETEIYQTKYKYQAGTHVLFRHREHIHRFGFRCAECHREDNCLRCHEKGKNHVQQTKTLEQHHNPCANCHQMDDPAKCDGCHRAAGEPPPTPFDHATTGWPLGRYHQGKRCRGCHRTVPFSKLERGCDACHGDWSPQTFDHSITGQHLSDDHADADCEECHADRRFDGPPACDACHDEEEGITFPGKRPGRVEGSPSP